MTLGELASLIVAYSDLAVVRAVTNAINANLPKTGPLGTIPPAALGHDPRPRIKDTPTKAYNPRTVLTPTPRYNPRVVINRTADRYEPCHKPAVVEVIAPPTYNRTPSPIQPIWATLPPVPHVSATQVVKVVHQKVDLQGRGSVLDVFV